jgi:hypothetical protein
MVDGSSAAYVSTRRIAKASTSLMNAVPRGEAMCPGAGVRLRLKRPEQTARGPWIRWVVILATEATPASAVSLIRLSKCKHSRPARSHVDTRIKRMQAPVLRYR